MVLTKYIEENTLIIKDGNNSVTIKIDSLDKFIHDDNVTTINTVQLSSINNNNKSFK